MRSYKVQYTVSRSYDKRKRKYYKHCNCRAAISKKMLSEIDVSEKENEITIELDKAKDCLIIRKKTDS